MLLDCTYYIKTRYKSGWIRYESCHFLLIHFFITLFVYIYIYTNVGGPIRPSLEQVLIQLQECMGLIIGKLLKPHKHQIQ